MARGPNDRPRLLSSLGAVLGAATPRWPSRLVSAMLGVVQRLWQRAAVKAAFFVVVAAGAAALTAWNVERPRIEPGHVATSAALGARAADGGDAGGVRPGEGDAIDDLTADAGRIAGWEVASATSFIRMGKIKLHYDPLLADDARALAKQIPTWWVELEEALGRDVEDELDLYFVTHSGLVADATGMPSWATGVANGRRGEIVFSYHRPDGARSELPGLVRHELAHVALHRAVGGRRIPTWLNEGIADSLGDGVNLMRAQTLAQAVFGARVPPLAELERGFGGSDEDVQVAYATSRDFIGWLRSRDADGSSFRHLVAELRRGRSLDAALLASYDATLSELETDWRGGLVGRFFWSPQVWGDGLPALLIGPLVVFAWRRRRHARAQAWDRLEREDAAEAAAAFARMQAAVPTTRSTSPHAMSSLAKPAMVVTRLRHAGL